MKSHTYKNRVLWGISTVIALSLCYILSRHDVLGQWHGMVEWPRNLFIFGVIVIIIAALLYCRRVMSCAVIGYIAGFIVAMLFSGDYAGAGDAPGVMSYNNAWQIWLYSYLATIAAGIVWEICLNRKHTLADVQIAMKSKIIGVIPLVAVMLAIIVMLLPTSAYLAFADAPEDRVNPDDRIIVYKSYFSLDLWGYAHFTPPATAYLSAVLAVLHSIGFIRKKPLRKAVLVISYICAILAALSVLSLLRYPLLPASIAVLLIVSAVMCTVHKHRSA